MQQTTYKQNVLIKAMHPVNDIKKHS